MKCYRVSYITTNLHQPDLILYLDATSETSATRVFQTKYPTASIVTLQERDEWTPSDLDAIKLIIHEAEAPRYRTLFPMINERSDQLKLYERLHSVEEVRWWEGGHYYTASFTTRCLADVTQAAGRFTKDGKPVSLCVVKNCLRRMIKKTAQKLDGTIFVS